jgi:hypothetical protein
MSAFPSARTLVSERFPSLRARGVARLFVGNREDRGGVRLRIVAVDQVTHARLQPVLHPPGQPRRGFDPGTLRHLFARLGSLGRWRVVARGHPRAPRRALPATAAGRSKGSSVASTVAIRLRLPRAGVPCRSMAAIPTNRKSGGIFGRESAGRSATCSICPVAPPIMSDGPRPAPARARLQAPWNTQRRRLPPAG